MIISPSRMYRLKKAFSIYPGTAKPVSAAFLTDYYGRRAAERRLPRKLADAVVAGAFHLWVPLRARSVARKFGLGRDWRKKAVRIARKRFADPNDLALFRIEAPEQMDAFMRRFEYAGISKRINPSGWRDDCSLTDKLRFRERCLKHGLPHPALLAIVRDGAAEVTAMPSGGALATKPADGEGGRGFRLLSYPEWERADAMGFAAFLEAELGKQRGTWLVQPRLANHPALRDISLSALSTVRMTTIRSKIGEPEIVTSVLRFPSSTTSIVDNIKAGGLMAPVDIEAGTLGPACRGKGMGEYAKHPGSGAVVEGRQLPFWPEARALVLRAHREAFPEYVMVGWDVALTPDGPVLIEGNGKPCIVVAQRATGRGVGDTRFGELIAHHLRESS